MAKILSKSGDSLADVYDVAGSIAGVDNLLSEDVNLVHEMGSTIFAERLSARVTILTSTALAQSLAWNVSTTFANTARLLGLTVLATNISRLDRVQVSITSPPAVDDTDSPIFIWDGTLDGARAITLLLSGTLTANVSLLPAIPFQLPSLIIGADSPSPANIVSFRGLTTAFGAGTVESQLILYTAFPEVGGLSSRGLPVPSW